MPGYKVFCGQPTQAGFEKAIEKACGDKWAKDKPIIWGQHEAGAHCLTSTATQSAPARQTKIGEYAELGNVSAPRRPTRRSS